MKYLDPLTPTMATTASQVRAGKDIHFIVTTDPDDRDDPVSDALRAGEFPVARLFDLVSQVVAPGARILDLGGHVGSFALACAAAGYKMVCVEASPRNAELIASSIAANAFEKHKHNKDTESSQPGTLKFHSQGPFG